MRRVERICKLRESRDDSGLRRQLLATGGHRFVHG